MTASREPLFVGAGAASQLADALTLLEQVICRLRVALDGPEPSGAFAHAERVAVVGAHRGRHRCRRRSSKHRW